ncbi:MAG: hypothetical protein WBV45_00770 [Lutimonas sp.]
MLRSILFFVLLVGCSSSKEQASKDQIPPPRVNCPEGGDCTFEVVQNSTLTLKTDPTGATYPEIEAGENVVIRYHYKKDQEPDALDSSYSEYLYFEITPGRVEISLKDSELQRVKMIFGRICFCKGETGYFPVKKGNLFIYQNEGDLLVRGAFSISKIPQTLKEIDERLTYYPKQ